MNRNFEQIIIDLERLCVKSRMDQSKPEVMRDCRLAIREAHAWTNFEVLDSLSEVAQSEWTRIGKKSVKHNV